MSIFGELTGFAQLAEMWGSMDERVGDDFTPGIQKTAHTLSDRISSYAPRGETGALQTEWVLEVTGHAEAILGTELPYAPRIQFGYRGTDSMGRTYHQPPTGFLTKALSGELDTLILEVKAVIDAHGGGT